MCYTIYKQFIRIGNVRKTSCWQCWMGKNKSNFAKSYDENIDERYIFEVDAEYPKKLQKKNNDFPFLSKSAKNLSANCTIEKRMSCI